MKYYIYISDTKIDMFHAQIPKKRISKIAGELGIDIGIVSAKIESEISLEKRVSRLEIVLKYLKEKYEIGSAQYPGEYFSGVEKLRWGYFGGNPVPMTDQNFNSPLVYFGGKVGKTIVGLGGSSKHVIGSVGNSWPHAHSGTPFIIEQLKNELSQAEKSAIEEWRKNTSTYFNDFERGALRAVQLATDNMEGPIHTMEFFAKRLLHKSVEEDSEDLATQTILGTPLYVAIKD